MRRLAVLSLVLFAACGPKPAPDLRAQITRAQIDRAPGALLLAEVPDLNVAATMAPVPSAPDVTVWRTADNVSLTFREGVLIATRGLGHDLMSADVAGTLAALRGGPQAGYPRLTSTLDGNNQTRFHAFLCDIGPPQAEAVVSFGVTFATVRRDETCYSTGVRIGNSYWLDPDGTVRRSRQWIGPEVGWLLVERLTR